MKIGYSLSRCVLDIVEGRVSLDEVEVIISRTNFDPMIPSQWRIIWKGYTVPNAWSDIVWRDHIEEEEKFKEVVEALHLSGRLFQPRKVVGFTPVRVNHIWKETKIVKG